MGSPAQKAIFAQSSSERSTLARLRSGHAGVVVVGGLGGPLLVRAARAGGERVLGPTLGRALQRVLQQAAAFHHRAGRPAGPP